MKNIRILFFLILILYCQNGFSQIHFEDGYWMPVSYLHKMVANLRNSDNDNYLKPVSCVLIRNNKILVRLYKDELRSTNVSNINKHEILLEGVFIPVELPGYKTAGVVTKFSDKKCYLYRTGVNKMFLIIKEKHKTIDSIQFSRFLNNSPIIDDKLIRFQIALFGKFSLSSNDKGINGRNILIDKNGNIGNSRILNSIILKGIPNIFTDVNDYYAFCQIRFLNSRQENVIVKINNSNTVFIYKNNQGGLGNLLFTLNREN